VTGDGAQRRCTAQRQVGWRDPGGLVRAGAVVGEANGTVMAEKALMQIGEVAEQTGLSPRTIRYYEEVGLIAPSARSQGGFRLYTDTDVQRLQVIKRMKPLDFTLDQMRDLLTIVDRLAGPLKLARGESTQLLASLLAYREQVQDRRAALQAQLATADDFATTLSEHIETINQHRADVAARR
jgi:DNA-binding transcriptional MerR regulator